MDQSKSKNHNNKNNKRSESGLSILNHKKNILTLIILIIGIVFYILLNFSTLSFWAAILKSLPGYQHNPDIGRDLHQLIESRGFKYENHFTTTEDGYILQLVRIINPFNKNQTKYRPIILFHGFQCTGSVFLINRNGYLDDYGNFIEFQEDGSIRNSSEQAINTLGFFLSSRGYDVWLYNYRGNDYSPNHTHLNSKDSEFWAFSMDELIDYDIPSTIDYVLNHTGYESATYIGYSQGSVDIIGLLSQTEKYNEKIKPIIALTPSAYMDPALIAKMATYFKVFIVGPKPYRWPIANPKLLRHPLAYICSNKYFRNFCIQFLYNTLFTFENNINEDRFGSYFGDIPGGASSWNVLQFMPMIQKGEALRKYDFGDKKINMEKYGQPVPPLYDYRRINSSHLVLVSAKFDEIYTLEHDERLIQEMNAPLLAHIVIDDDYSDHMSPVWGKRAYLFHEPVLNVIKKYD